MHIDFGCLIKVVVLLSRCYLEIRTLSHPRAHQDSCSSGQPCTTLACFNTAHRTSAIVTRCDAHKLAPSQETSAFCSAALSVGLHLNCCVLLCFPLSLRTLPPPIQRTLSRSSFCSPAGAESALTRGQKGTAPVDKHDSKPSASGAVRRQPHPSALPGRAHSVGAPRRGVHCRWRPVTDWQVRLVLETTCSEPLPYHVLWFNSAITLPGCHRSAPVRRTTKQP